MIRAEYPIAAPRDGYQWSLCWEHVPVTHRHTVTGADVRHAIVYGLRMVTTGQVIEYRSTEIREYWGEVKR